MGQLRNPGAQPLEQVPKHAGHPTFAWELQQWVFLVSLSLSLSISISVCSHLASCKPCTSHLAESVKKTSEILRAPVAQKQLAVSTPGSSLNFQGEAFGARALELWISGSLGDGTQSLAVSEGGRKIGGALEAKGFKGAAENRYGCDTAYVCIYYDRWLELDQLATKSWSSLGKS